MKYVPCHSDIITAPCRCMCAQLRDHGIVVYANVGAFKHPRVNAHRHAFFVICTYVRARVSVVIMYVHV